jgi:hypothetical protein
VLWLFALRPLSVGDVALVLLVAFGAAWILELLQRRPDELAALPNPDVTADGDLVDSSATAVSAPTLELSPTTGRETTIPAAPSRQR